MREINRIFVENGERGERAKEKRGHLHAHRHEVKEGLGGQLKEKEKAVPAGKCKREYLRCCIDDDDDDDNDECESVNRRRQVL